MSTFFRPFWWLWHLLYPPCLEFRVVGYWIRNDYRTKQARDSEQSEAVEVLQCKRCGRYELGTSTTPENAKESGLRWTLQKGSWRSNWVWNE